jgi:hypothetical protein
MLGGTTVSGRILQLSLMIQNGLSTALAPM